MLVSAALVDVAEHRLPNGLVAVAALPVVVMLIAAGSGDLARSAAVGAVMFAGPLLLTHLVSPAGMGFGDVKAGAVLGAALGLIDPQVALLALVLGLASAAAWGLARRARSVAFGPGLVTGALLALAIGRAAGRRGGDVVSIVRLLLAVLAVATVTACDDGDAATPDTTESAATELTTRSEPAETSAAPTTPITPPSTEPPTTTQPPPPTTSAEDALEAQIAADYLEAS